MLPRKRDDVGFFSVVICFIVWSYFGPVSEVIGFHQSNNNAIRTLQRSAFFRHRCYDTKRYYNNKNDDSQVSAPSNNDSFRLSRRQFGISTVAGASTLLLPTLFQYTALADETLVATTITTTSTTNSLNDLPLLDKSKFVRLYLCRHGETDNNKLKLIQGARIDAPINEKGQQQAALLGQALAQAVSPPELFFHSPLIRAQQTAQIAASQFGMPQPPLQDSLPALMEIDFGPIAEGAPVEEMRARMIATYTAWGLGNLDVRMVGQGESGNEVLARIESALETLVESASTTSTGSIAAVAHSVYLRALLSSIETPSLFQPSKLLQSNCCVNVVDFPRKTAATTTSLERVPIRVLAFASRESPINLFQPKPNDVPITTQGKIIRINESRHLEGLN